MKHGFSFITVKAQARRLKIRELAQSKRAEFDTAWIRVIDRLFGRADDGGGQVSLVLDFLDGNGYLAVEFTLDDAVFRCRAFIAGVDTLFYAPDGAQNRTAQTCDRVPVGED